MNKKAVGNIILSYILMTIGSLIYSVGVSIFVDPYNLAPGGITGVGIIIASLLHAKTGTVIFCINLPILIFGTWRFGLKFIISTLYVTTISSAMMNGIADYIMPVIGLVTEDVLIAGAAGGAFMAIGMAMIFKQGGTTGGSDIIVRALRQKYPHIKTGKIYLITDTMVIICSVIAFHNLERGLYAAVVVIVTNFVLDMFLYSGDGAKLVYIISDNIEAIAARVMNELELGATYINGVGAYTNEEKKVLMVVAKASQYAQIRDVVREEDKDSFVIVSGASEVFGYGYKDIFTMDI
ncbi:MAG: YitT family protein [Lachnospiraceae bacterium]|nr:YitT family protein [Lachnospiraceae bacterium]